MDETNDLSISLGLDPTGLRQGLNEAERSVGDAGRRISSSLESIGNLGQRLAGLGATLTAGITVPIIGIATASVKAYGEIQALQKGLEAVAGSTTYANKQFDNLKEVAKLPGLGLQEAVKGSINLQAIGLSAGKAENILLQFGNAIASVGKGRVEFDRAIYGITQLANTEFPLGEDLNIVADALPQVRTLLKDTFGKTRSDDLAKMGVTSKMVLDTILKGLTDLPRVNGGIKNAFENLGDSIQQNLARVGKVLDDNLNISALIDKLTNAIETVVSAFEDLSPTMQKVVLAIVGVASAIGPLLLVIGGVMALIPTLTAGFSALGTAITAATGPIGILVIALTALSIGLYSYYSNLEDATDRQERWAESLQKAEVSARNENAELKKNYSISQDVKASLEDRNKAIDQLQKQYPAYFGNLSNEAILAGKAGVAYKQLTVDITNASRARAASSELDKRNARRLEEDIALQNKLTQSVKDYNNAQDRTISTENGEVFISGETARKAALGRNRAFLAERRQLAIDRAKEDAFLLKTVNDGANAIVKLETTIADDIAKASTPKVKKESEKQLAEIYPIGSIAELRQRADLLVKAIETSNNDIIKVRGLDKFGKDKDKAGMPVYTGEILSREKAVDRLAELNMLIGEELKPVNFEGRGLVDSLGNEFKSVNDLLASETSQTYTILNTLLPLAFTDGLAKVLEAIKAADLEKRLKELNDSLSQTITGATVDAISETFASIGTAIAQGGNVITAIGSVLISSFGNLLKDFGKQLIAYGVGMIAVKLAMSNPYLAIVAGAALVALGAGLTASASRTASAAPTGSPSTQTGASASNNNYSGSYTSGGSYGGVGYIELRLSGQDAVALINRNVLEQDRLTAG